MRPLLSLAFATLIAALPAKAQYAGDPWQSVAPDAYPGLADDDLDRHSADAAFWANIRVAERRFSENGFEWHLIRFANLAKPDGPLWVVPHDDENAAFEAMIDALKKYGGVGIAVNTAPDGKRRQLGRGTCGGRVSSTNSCDPNRNFDPMSPIFTAAFLYDYQPGHPVIALHTNSPGYSGDGAGGRGDITMLDPGAGGRGEFRVRPDGHFGNRSVAMLDNPDVYAIIPYLANAGTGDAAAICRTELNEAGVNVWHERVGRSDGSLSNYVALQRPDIAYVNFEATRDTRLEPAIQAQMLMIDTYLQKCGALWGQPVPDPAITD